MSKYSKCLIRKKWVVLTPEEKIRQILLQKMIGELGFPRGLISIEKGIGFRRTDLICYSREMTPLLLIECKADAIDEAAMRQAFGYNDTVKAPFVCLASAEKTLTLWHERGKIASVPFLPVYGELYEMSRRL